MSQTRREIIEEILFSIRDKDVPRGKGKGGKAPILTKSLDAKPQYTKNAVKNVVPGTRESEVIAFQHFYKGKKGAVFTETGFGDPDFNFLIPRKERLTLPIYYRDLDHVEIGKSDTDFNLFYKDGTIKNVYSYYAHFFVLALTRILNALNSKPQVSNEEPMAAPSPESTIDDDRVSKLEAENSRQQAEIEELRSRLAKAEAMNKAVPASEPAPEKKRTTASAKAISDPEPAPAKEQTKTVEKKDPESTSTLAKKRTKAVEEPAPEKRQTETVEKVKAAPARMQTTVAEDHELILTPEEQYTDLVNRVKNGDTEAIVPLALCFRDGIGTKEKTLDYLYLLTVAANQGVQEAKDAIVNEGAETYYQHAILLDQFKRYREAKDFLLIAASLGKAQAWCDLGLYAKKGYGDDADPQEAIRYFNKAADNGIFMAEYYLAVMYDLGEGIAEDKQLAAFWYERSAKHGHDAAQFFLASMYQEGVGVPEDKQKAVYWYRKAADQGHALAQYYLAEMYDEGDGIPVDKQKAYYWYEKAAQQGEKEAFSSLAWMLNEGDGVQADIPKSIYWFEKAAKSGDTVSQTTLGLIYYHGDGVPEDKEKALYWFKQAADEDESARNNLIEMYLHGDGTAVDMEQAIFWLKKSAGKLDADAQYKLGLIYKNGDGVAASEKEAFHWFDRAADNGNVKAEYELAFLYAHSPYYSQGNDYFKAVKLFEHVLQTVEAKAPDSDGELQYALGKMYLLGDGVQADVQKACYWFKKAAGQGDDDARELFDMITYWDNNASANEKKENVNTLIEALKGDFSAQNEMGNMYQYGDIPFNAQKAKYWYEKAMANGSPIAKWGLNELKQQYNV